MRKTRWIEYQGEWWTLSRLAESHHMAVGTLAARLERLPVERALATGLVSRETSGQRGKVNSPWTLPLHPNKNGAT